MIAIDFNQVLDFQFQESKKEYKEIFSWHFLIKSIFSIRRLVKKVNRKLTNQLLNSKGIYAYLLENVSDLKDKDLSASIATVEKTIKELLALESDLDIHLSSPKFQDFKTTHIITKEILDVTYNILRLLKKNNLKKPLADISEEAKVAIGHSTNTLNKRSHSC